MRSKNQTVKECVNGLNIKRFMSYVFVGRFLCRTKLSDDIENIKIYDTTLVWMLLKDRQAMETSDI